MIRPVGLGLVAVASLGAALFNSKSPAAKPEIQSLDVPVASTLAMQTVAYTGARAPEFPAGLTWLNTQKPLSLAALRGKIVLLDFWTYGCINCIHVLPDLKKLEAKYPKELVVISVHSAKFEQESEAKNIRDAVLRYGIEHPVLVDKAMRVWDEYTVRAWPTMVLIDPAGKIAGQVAGEGNYEVLDTAIGRLAKTFREQKKLNETPLQLALERAKVAPAPLFYPGKIAVGSDQVFVADSSHNRLVVSDKNGANSQIIGAGEAGWKDGDFKTAQFSNPQGLFWENGVLYVADTGNHAIRAVDFAQKTVSTLAGTGKQAPWGATGGESLKSPLSSPWDVLKIGDGLFIAMAGTHQIWRLDLAAQKVEVWAGTGGEARRDGPRLEALFAQPSGLATDGKSLFVADSESSCIRTIDFASGQVQTLAGGDLFEFGDRDGLGDAVRLQHPLGLAYKDGFLFLTDTYNGKIKKLEIQNGRVTTLFGGQNQLSEPGGLALDGDKLWIADTAHHAIKTLDLGAAKTTTLALNVAPPTLKTIAAPSVDAKVGNRVVLAPNAKTNLIFQANLPAGFHLNRAAPLSLKIAIKGSGISAKTREFRGAKFVSPLSVPLQTGKTGAGTLEIEALVSYCNDGDGAICKIEKVERKVPFQIGDGGVSQFQISADLE